MAFLDDVHTQLTAYARARAVIFTTADGAQEIREKLARQAPEARHMPWLVIYPNGSTIQLAVQEASVRAPVLDIVAVDDRVDSNFTREGLGHLQRNLRDRLQSAALRVLPTGMSYHGPIE